MLGKKKRRKIEAAQNAYDLEEAAKLRYGTLPQLQKELKEAEEKEEGGKENSLLRGSVTAEEISKIVSRWTGIPVSKLLESEREKLLSLPKIIHEHVIGQDEAVVRSFSSARPVSAKRSLPRSLPKRCLTMKRT